MSPTHFKAVAPNTEAVQEADSRVDLHDDLSKEIVEIIKEHHGRIENIESNEDSSDGFPPKEEYALDFNGVLDPD